MKCGRGVFQIFKLACAVFEVYTLPTPRTRCTPRPWCVEVYTKSTYRTPRSWHVMCKPQTHTTAVVCGVHTLSTQQAHLHTHYTHIKLI